MNTVNDQKINKLQEIKINDLPEFNRIYKNNYLKVLNFVKYRTNYSGDAEDITAETFRKAAIHFNNYDSEKNINYSIYFINA